MQAEQNASPQFGVILLAAGASRRMGRQKLLLPWGHSTVLGMLLDLWKSACACQIAIVLDARNHEVLAELDRLDFPVANRIVNPDPDRGMFSSIQCAAQWNGWDSAITHLVLSLGDQPHLAPALIRELLSFAAAHPDRICQPLFQGRPRHPVVFPRDDFQAVGSSTAPTLKEHLVEVAGSIATMPASDPGLEWDLDTPADYERLKEWQSAKPH
jgi:molybdenum cofactor cytidylyltransferase